MSAPEFTQLLDLAQERLGGSAVWCTDEFFAPMSNLVRPGRGVFIADKYTEFGKWMDGWESRRKRNEGHDWCVLRLGVAGRVAGVDVDTNHFTGNYPHSAKLEGAVLDEAAAAAVRDWERDVEWRPLVARYELGPSRQNYAAAAPAAADAATAWTHVRLHIYPDGGVARLRVYGVPVVREQLRKAAAAAAGGLVDLAAAVNGGLALAASDEHFGVKNNAIMPGRGVNMGDGWETRRRRGPGYDWLIIRLAAPGSVRRIEIDTAHFKGNFPDSADVDGALLGADLPSATAAVVSLGWKPLLPRQKLAADAVLSFDVPAELQAAVVDHIRLNIHPDGGVSRIRVWGVEAAVPGASSSSSSSTTTTTA